MCIADFETEPACVQSPAGAADPFANRFPVGLDRVPFFDCFAGSPGDASSHGISNHPDFPDKLAGAGFPSPVGMETPALSTLMPETSGCAQTVLREGRPAS
jgi:hypothetical protein